MKLNSVKDVYKYIAFLFEDKILFCQNVPIVFLTVGTKSPSNRVLGNKVF